MSKIYTNEDEDENEELFILYCQHDVNKQNHWRRKTSF